MKQLLLAIYLLGSAAIGWAQSPRLPDSGKTRKYEVRKPPRAATVRAATVGAAAGSSTAVATPTVPLYVEPVETSAASAQVLEEMSTAVQAEAAHSNITLQPLCAEWITRDLATLSQESAAAGLTDTEATAVNQQFLRELFAAFQRRDSTGTSWSATARAYGEADYTPIIGRIFTPTPIIVITTTPPDAQVELLTPQGPRPLGKTALRKPLDCGKYRLVFSKPGYQSVTKTVVARRYPREQNVTLKLLK